MTDSARVTEICITPSTAQYEQLVRDLRVLRHAGAESNTQAIVDAVHDAALHSHTLPAVVEQRRAA